MGSSPIIINAEGEPASYALYSSTVDDWTTYPCTREEIETIMLLNAVESSYHSITSALRRARTLDKLKGEWDRIQDPPTMGEEGGMDIPDEVVVAARTLWEYARHQDEEMDARMRDQREARATT